VNSLSKLVNLSFRINFLDFKNNYNELYRKLLYKNLMFCWCLIMSPNISVILFDMDGVLTDSIDLWFNAVTTVFHRYFNENPSREKFNKYLHKSTREMIRGIVDLSTPSSELIDKLTAMVDGCFESEMIPKLQPIPNAENLIKDLYRRKYRLGVVTNGSETTSKKMIRHLGLIDYFEYIFGCNGEKPKPDPALLLKALKQFNVEPEECVYIGDSYTDLLASNKAEIHFIYYQNREIPEMVKYKGLKVTKLLDILLLMK